MYCNSVFAQHSNTLDELMEKYMESVEENDDIDLNLIREKFELLIENPLNLNDCDEEDLRDLELLSDQQINSFFKYRNELGKLISVNELQSIPQFDLNTIYLLLPVVTIGDYSKDYHVSLVDMLGGSKKTLFLKTKTNIETKAGYLADENSVPKYAGNKFTYYSRLKINYENRLDIGLIAEKDPGELFFSGYNKQGFDYYSGHIFLYKYRERIKELNLGDYTISLGQGLILHNDFGRGKSALVTKIKKNSSRVIRPYSSVNENLYFRGIGSTFKINKYSELSLFASQKYIDANIEADTMDFENINVYASSLQITGYHRLQSEIEGKHSVKQKAGGVRLALNLKQIKLGLNIFALSHDKQLIRQDKLYNKFRFAGKSLTNISLDYSFITDRILFFGELARSKNNAFALLQGIQYIPSSKMDIAILYRNYSKSYESLNSNSFGESIGTNNENGLYLGVNLNLSHRWSLSFYHDIWENPWLKYNVSSSGTGSEFFAILKYKKRHKYSFYIQFKNENKSKDIRTSDYFLYKTVPGDTRRLRLHQNIILNKSWELRNRLEFSYHSLDKSISKGVLFYQDILFKPMQFPLAFTFRYAIFDTDDYYSGIYAYENDILGESLIPVYFNKGFRTYINLRYRPNTNITAELRWDRWYYPYEKEIGSGTELIDSNHKTGLKMQLKLNF